MAFTNWNSEFRVGDGLSLPVAPIACVGLKVSPVFYLSDAQMEQYLAEHQLPNEWDYYAPAKADEKRECGLHVAWGGKATR